MTISAQVGINTTSPSATLDVKGKSTVTDTDGLIAPRLTRAQLTAKGNTLYGPNQDGAIIYITDISAGDTASQRINITTKGYYYFDNGTNQWKILSYTAPPAVKTILIADGTPMPNVNTIGAPGGQRSVAGGNFTSQRGGNLFFTGYAGMSCTVGGVTIGFILYMDGVEKDRISQYYENPQKIASTLNFIISGIPTGNHTWDLRITGNTSAINYSFTDANHRMAIKLIEL
ncbi:hypothetical protein F3J23_11035 [Chryseobacterium sp. Tr-659]|uniref:hypothetical protein n=1 Tax=Chryseobacterium sp. Tr-659 TaxID=2608340 RepID=UPI0014237E10|nr:hypothetical protein [Chryseobacterium sp. Tr-659]NIF05975.1 hypothetical protein [Chryseobacterium sp. Tr-659]